MSSKAAGKRPFQVQAANSTPITSKSITIFKSEMDQQVNSLATGDIYIILSLLKSDQHASRSQVDSFPPTNPIKALFQNITDVM